MKKLHLYSLILGVILGVFISPCLSPFILPARAQSNGSTTDVDKRLDDVITAQTEIKKRLENIITQTQFIKAASGK